MLLAIGDREVAVLCRVGAASRFEMLQRLVLAAEARQHDAEAVVADRDVARAVRSLERLARGAEADERRLELAGLCQSDADLPVATGCGALVSDRQVLLAVAFELFDAAENVWHNGGAYCAFTSPWRISPEISRQFRNFLVMDSQTHL